MTGFDWRMEYSGQKRFENRQVRIGRREVWHMRRRATAFHRWQMQSRTFSCDTHGNQFKEGVAYLLWPTTHTSGKLYLFTSYYTPYPASAFARTCAAERSTCLFLADWSQFSTCCVVPSKSPLWSASGISRRYPPTVTISFHHTPNATARCVIVMKFWWANRPIW